MPRQDQATAAPVGTFLVADIRGYTAFTSHHGDEAASRLTRAFAEIVAEGVEAWAGSLVELRGDEALAVFGSPRAALRAAVDLQAAFLDEAYARPDLPLKVGIGLDAGEAVPHEDGYRGAALNLAARLCGASGAGDVHASAGVVHLAGPIKGLRYEATEDVSVKGVDEPVRAFLVRADAGSPGRSGGSSATSRAISEPLPPELDPLVPLAGRVAELRWLGWHWRRARHGHGRTVILSGVPGIGKTRLAAELAARVRADGASVTYLPSAFGIDDLAPVADPADVPPSLLIVDDLEAAPERLVDATAGAAGGVRDRAILLVVIHRTEASAVIREAVERMAPDAQRRELGPLDLEAVRMIAALYAGEAVDELPLARIQEETKGHPASVHRAAHEWARRIAAQRVGIAADRTASGRSDLRIAELALIGDMATVEQARERGLLYGVAAEGARGGWPSAPTGRPDSAICPYKGLAPYETTDAEFYFGRERLIAELTARLVGNSFLGIVGASGSGKSSALQAGLLPALAGGVLPGSEHWPLVTVRPGDRPMTALREALARTFEAIEAESPGSDEGLAAALDTLPAGARLVLFVDQFEEIFTSPDVAERAACIDLISEERPGLLVIVAMRADHYGHAAAYPSLARQLASNQVLIGAMTSAELASVIEHPAEYVGLRVEPALTEALIGDAGIEPGVLPLLSTALLELWRDREGDRLTLAAYRAGGGLHGSVARLAEAAWASLDPDRQTIARAILLRLAGAGEGDDVVRRRVARDEFDVDREPLPADVLDRLVAARLLTTDEGSVEVAHEALLREWPRLRGWLDENANGRQLHLHLASAARDWEAEGRESGDLYRGARLAAALDWTAEHPEQLNTLEREFLDKSRSVAEREAEDQRRANRRLRYLLAGVGILLVLAIGTGVFAGLEARRANEQRAVAQDQTALARAQGLAASAIAALDDDPSLAKLLALEAASSDDPPLTAISALHTALAADVVTHRFELPPVELSAPWVDVDPDARWLAVSGLPDEPRASIDVMDLGTGESRWQVRAPEGAVASVARFTPDGERLVSGMHAWGDGGGASPAPHELGIGIWDAESGERLGPMIAMGPCGAAVYDVSSTHALALVPVHGSTRGAQCFDEPFQLELVSLDDGAREVLTPDAEGFLRGPGLSGDGRYVGFVDRPTGQVVVMDVKSGDRRTIPLAADFDMFHGLNSDGSLVLLGSTFAYPGDLVVLDVDSASRSGRIRAHGGPIWHAQFLPWTDTVVSMGADGELGRWDVASGEPLRGLPAAGSGWPTPIAEGRVGVIDLAGPAPLFKVVDTRPRGEGWPGVDSCRGIEPKSGLAVPMDTLHVQGNEAIVATACEADPSIWDQTTQVLDLRSGDVKLAAAGKAAQGQALSPDGERFARQEISREGVIRGIAIRDIATGAVVTTLEGFCEWDEAAWDEAGPPWPDREPFGDCRAFPDAPFAFRTHKIDWSPDGRLIAAMDDLDYGGAIAVWDAVTGKLAATFPRPQVPSAWDALYVDHVFSPDGRRVLATSMAVEPGPDGRTGMYLDEISTDTWALERHRELRIPDGSRPRGGGALVSLAGFAPDGETLYGIAGFLWAGGGARLVWIDSADLDVSAHLSRTNDAQYKSQSLSPDGTRLALGSSDGLVRIWDMAAMRQVHELSFRDTYPDQQVQGLAWIDGRHLTVALSGGVVLVVTTDADELLQLTRESLTRSFTPTECVIYAIEDCPELADLRALDVATRS